MSPLTWEAVSVVVVDIVVESSIYQHLLLKKSIEYGGCQEQRIKGRYLITQTRMLACRKNGECYSDKEIKWQ